MFPDILTPQIEAKARENASLVEYRDDPEAFEKLAGHSIDSLITMEKIDEFRQHYSHIRVYHACRPQDVQTYYKEGVRLRCKEIQLNRFRSIFLNGDYPDLTEEMLQQSIEKLTRYSDPDGTVDLALDDKWIVEQCGHYLIYGSEDLSALVCQLPIEQEKYQQYRSVLRQIGKPTILEINLPNTHEYVCDDYLRELIYDMITNWVYNVAHSKMESGSLDFTFSINKPLPLEHICGYYHPTKIPDKSMGNKIYDAETGEYENKQNE